MSGELKHIFDKSACLSRRQLKDYISGHMASEETHALEHHLNDCPLCSAAVDGMLLNPEKALEAVGALNTDFLKEHFGITTPEVHLNSMSPADAVAPQIIQTPKAKIKVNIQPLWRNVSIAAAIILAFGLFWYLKDGESDSKSTAIAQKLDTETVAPLEPAEAVKADPPAPENTVAASEPPAAVPAPATETEAKPAQDNAAGAGIKQAPDPKLADAKKAKEDIKPVTLAAAAPTPADKKLQQEKAKATAEVKKNDTKTTLAKAAPVTNKTAEREEQRRAVAQTTTVDKQETSNRAAATEVATRYSAPPSAARDEKPSASSSGAAGNSSGEQMPADKLDKGKYYFDNQKWNDALKEYKVEINNSSKARRHTASVMAAQCYIKLGNKKEAERLLKIVVDEGGSDKRRAKKLLESITEKEAEKK